MHSQARATNARPTLEEERRSITAVQPPRSKWWTPLAFGLFCGHCVLAAFLGVLGVFGVAAGPRIFGLSVHWFWPPALILGVFAWLLSSGPSASCGIPQERR